MSNQSHRENPLLHQTMARKPLNRVPLKPEPTGNLIDYGEGFKTGITIGIGSVIILFVTNRISKNLSPSLSPKTLAIVGISCGLSGVGRALVINKGWISADV